MGLTEVAMVGEATAEATVVALGPEDPVPRAWTDMRVSFILNINRTLGYMLWFARFGLTRHVARLGRGRVYGGYFGVRALEAPSLTARLRAGFRLRDGEL